MKFDAQKRENLSPAMRAGIAQLMQYALLDEIFSAGAWKSGDIVFQGGTGLHIVYNSPRFSEDLDFMLAVDKSHDITRIMERAAREMQKRLSLVLPRSEMRIKSGGGEAGSLRDVLRHDVVWSHPAKMGSVRVRAEFFTIERAHMDAYRRENRRHRPDVGNISARPELQGFDIETLTVNSLIPAASPESIYGDKMVALAKRGYTKARDFYDLWWLNRTLGVQLGGDNLYEAARRSADCYVYDDHEIARGLRTLMQNPPELSRTLDDNLQAFLPAELHKRLSRDGAFEEMYAHAMDEAGRLETAVMDRAGPEIAP